MAKQDIIISIQLKGAGGAAKEINQVAKAQEQLAKMQTQEAVDLEVANLQKKIQKDINVGLAKSQLGLASATGLTAKQMKASRAQSGLNNAILLETGRLASDASYGFTAIANNLSQVVSLMTSFAETSGGLGKSLKSLAGSLMGTGGLLIGLQLIISFGPQIFDFFARLLGATRELRDAMKGAADTIKQQTGSFEIYTRTLQNGWKSSEEMADATKMLKKEFPEYIKLLKDAGLSTEDLMNGNKEAIRITKEYTKQIKIQAMARQAAIKIEEEAANIIQVQVDREVKAREEGFTSIKDVQLRLKASEDALVEFNEKNKNKTIFQLTERERKERIGIEGRIENLKKITELNQDEVDDAEKTIDILMEFTDIQTKDTKKGYGKRERNFKQHLLDLDKLEESYRQKAIDTQMMTAEEIIDEEEKNAKAELKIRVDSFKAKQLLRLNEFLETTEDADERKKANDEYNESIRLADEESRQVTIELENSFNTKRTQLIRKRNEDDAKEQERADDILKQYLDGRIETQKTFEEESNELYYNANENRIQQDMDFIAKRIELETEDVAVRAELQSQYYSLQDELRQNDLERELSSIEAKKNVNMEYVGFAEQTGSLLEKLGNRSKALANVALAVEKGAAIAKVIVSAQASIATKTASANAIPAFLPPFGTPNPSFLVAQAEAKASNTRTKISAALSIANILASLIGKKGAPKDTSGGGGGRGSVQIQAPDFNIVGASQTSQLAEAVATQKAKPVKAFVVGKDISSQQELDRNITNTASFG
jgi:hypothetical protein